MIVDLLPSSPHHEIALDVLDAPVACFLAIAATNIPNFDHANAVAHFHQFFASLALQFEFELDWRLVVHDVPVHADLLETVCGFALRDGEDGVEVGWGAIDFALAVGSGDLETVAGFAEKGYFFGDHVEISGLVVFDLIIFNNHASMVDGQLHHRAY